MFLSILSYFCETRFRHVWWLLEITCLFCLLVCAGKWAAGISTYDALSRAPAGCCPPWALSPFSAPQYPPACFCLIFLSSLTSPAFPIIFRVCLLHPDYIFSLLIGVNNSCIVQKLVTATPASVPTPSLVLCLASYRSESLPAFVPAFLPCACPLSALSFPFSWALIIPSAWCSLLSTQKRISSLEHDGVSRWHTDRPCWNFYPGLLYLCA